MSANALMIDYGFCTGCHACEVACKKHLGLPAGQHGIRVLQFVLAGFTDMSKYDDGYGKVELHHDA